MIYPASLGLFAQASSPLRCRRRASPSPPQVGSELTPGPKRPLQMAARACGPLARAAAHVPECVACAARIRQRRRRARRSQGVASSPSSAPPPGRPGGARSQTRVMTTIKTTNISATAPDYKKRLRYSRECISGYLSRHIFTHIYSVAQLMSDVMCQCPSDASGLCGVQRVANW